MHFKHDSQNSFSVHHVSRTPKMVDHGVTKISLPLPFQELKLTMRPTKTPIESLCVYCTYIFSVGSMEQKTFVVSSIVFIHFLLSHHVLLVKMRILNSLDFLDMHSTSGCLKFVPDNLILRGAWGKCHSIYFHIRAWHWSPRARKRNSFGRYNQCFQFYFPLGEVKLLG